MFQYSKAHVRVPKLFIQLKYLLSSKHRDIHAEPNFFLQLLCVGPQGITKYSSTQFMENISQAFKFKSKRYCSVLFKEGCYLIIQIFYQDMIRFDLWADNFVQAH